MKDKEKAGIIYIWESGTCQILWLSYIVHSQWLFTNSLPHGIAKAKAVHQHMFNVQYLTVVLERKDKLTATYVLATAAPCCAEEIIA